MPAACRRRSLPARMFVGIRSAESANSPYRRFPERRSRMRSSVQRSPTRSRVFATGHEERRVEATETFRNFDMIKKSIDTFKKQATCASRHLHYESHTCPIPPCMNSLFPPETSKASFATLDENDLAKPIA